jgi:hypothetical protein
MKGNNIAKIVLTLAAGLAIAAATSGCIPIQKRDGSSGPRLLYHEQPCTNAYKMEQKRRNWHRQPHSMTPYKIRDKTK